LLSKAAETAGRTLRNDKETLQQSKDREYAYWQRRAPAERPEAVLEMSFALFGLEGDEADLRRRFLESPRILPCPWLFLGEQKS
jgi:hypothetical protein